MYYRICGLHLPRYLRNVNGGTSTWHKATVLKLVTSNPTLYMVHFDDGEKVEVGADPIKLCAEGRGKKDTGSCLGSGPNGQYMVGARVEYRFDGVYYPGVVAAVKPGKDEPTGTAAPGSGISSGLGSASVK